MKPAPEPPEEFNPYAPPQASLARPATGSHSLAPASRSCWRQGNIAFIPHGRQLPARCIRCNAPACLPMAQWRLSTFTGQHSLIYYGLCRRHTSQRRMTLGLTVLAFITAVLIRFHFRQPPSFASQIEFPLFLGAFISGIVHSRLLVPVWAGVKAVAIKGCRTPFLDSLPDSSDLSSDAA